MVSARADDGYFNLSGVQPEEHNSNPSDVDLPKEGEQYDQVRLSQLNAEAELLRSNGKQGARHDLF